MTDETSLRQHMSAFQRHLTSLHYSRFTIFGYCRSAAEFLDYIGARGMVSPPDISTRDIEAWRQAMQVSNRHNPASIATRLRGLHAFNLYLVEVGVIKRDLFVGMPRPQLPRAIPRDVLSEKETRLLLRAPDTRYASGRQRRMIIELLYATGVRVSELCALDVPDVDTEECTLRVSRGKGGKDRIVPFGDSTASHLKQHIAETRADMPDPRIIGLPLFKSRSGHRITSDFVQRLLRQEADHCGLMKHVTPHVLRHACATHMYSRGAGLLHIKQLLGHADITTTQIYTRVAPREAQRTHAASHPRERLFRQMKKTGLHLPDSGCSSLGRNVRHMPVVIRPSGQHSPGGYGVIPSSREIPEGLRVSLLAYHRHLMALNRTERTIRTHLARLLLFTRFIMGSGAEAWPSVNRGLIHVYRETIAASIQHRKQPGNIAVENQFMAVLACFFRFLAYQGVIDENPTEGMRYAREPTRLPVYTPSTEVMRRLLDQPDLKTALGLRDRAIMELMYSSGLRKMEVLTLPLDAVDHDNRRVSVWQGKGARDRVVPLGKVALHFIQSYLVHSRPLLLDRAAASKFLFLSGNGRRMSKNTIYGLVEKYALQAGFHKHDLTPHSFRHAFATHLIQNGAKLRHVQEMLGHAKLSSTQVYVHLTISDLRRAYQSYHPLG